MQNWRPTAGPDMLALRAEVLARCRAYFAGQGVMEVCTPALSNFGATEPSIASFTVSPAGPRKGRYYLHTSPEFPMKRLLAAGSGPIYQLCTVFRDGDSGRCHRPEFTMLEWYRPGWTYRRLMDDVEQLVRSLPGRSVSLAATARLSYRELFRQTLSLDPVNADARQCRACCRRHGLAEPDNMDEDDIDGWLDLLMAALIAPQLPGDRLSFVYDYPPGQAALARVRRGEGGAVAERFELYWGALELANGFQELTDATEQRRRFERENELRRRRGLETVPVDEWLLEAMQAGLPECSGVALGVDRLLMALSGAADIREVMAFGDELRGM